MKKLMQVTFASTSWLCQEKVSLHENEASASQGDICEEKLPYMLNIYNRKLHFQCQPPLQVVKEAEGH